MESDFRRAFDVYFRERKATLLPEQAAAHETYAVGNRERARSLCYYLRGALTYHFAGKRILDVGSGYGGLVIECANLGAEAYGIEIDRGLHDLALANASRERGNPVFLQGDILDMSLAERCGKEPFDLIIVNDVFEHIYDSSRLFDRLAALSGADTVIYFAIPNGVSYRSIRKECHYFRFGLSLLDPSDWNALVGVFNVYYRPLRCFQLLFQDAGYPFLYVALDEATKGESAAAIGEVFRAIEEEIKRNPLAPPYLNDNLRHRFRIVKQQMEHDLRQSARQDFVLKYSQDYWTGFAVKKPVAGLQDDPNTVRLECSRKDSQT